MNKKEFLKKYNIINNKNKYISVLIKDIYIEINIENYCEILHKDYSWSTLKVDNKNPFEINYINDAIGFRFYDVSYVIVNNEEFIGKNKNFSSFFYYGKKYNKKELNEMLFINPSQQILDALNIMEVNKINSIILCDCGEIITNPINNSTTTEELKINYKYKNNKIKTKI